MGQFALVDMAWHAGKKHDRAICRRLNKVNSNAATQSSHVPRGIVQQL
jgi:Zn-dependent oligopeptidase